MKKGDSWEIFSTLVVLIFLIWLLVAVVDYLIV